MSPESAGGDGKQAADRGREKKKLRCFRIHTHNNTAALISFLSISDSWIDAHRGEAYALANAIAWAVSVVLFRVLGKTVPPFGLNLFKNAVGLVFLVGTCLLLGQALWPSVESRDVWMLLASGALGIGIADILFLRAINLLGASRTAVVECLYSPFVILFSWMLLGETLSLWGLLGAGLVVASVLLLFEKHEAGGDRGAFWRGAGLGGLSLAMMAFGIVFVKPQLDAHPVLWASTVRMVGGVLVLLIMLPWQRDRAAIAGLFLPDARWRILLPTSVIAAYIAILFWIAGMKYTQTNISSILNQTSAVWIVLLAAIFLRERLTWRKALALGLALTGSGMILLG